LNLNELEAKTHLLKANYSISKEKINTCEDWIKWLANSGRDIILKNIFQILKEFVTT